MNHEKTIIGKNCLIHPSVIYGTPPQHLEYYRKSQPDNNPGTVVIGDNVIIREFVNVHLPMNRMTKIADNCFIMSHCHVAHDCILEENVILATGAHLGGHTRIMQGAVLGLNCCTHQYTTTGSYAMVGMGAVVTKDILPFTVYNNKHGCYKINEIGMERNGFSALEIQEVENHYSFHDAISSDRVSIEITRFHAIRNRGRKLHLYRKEK